MPTSEEGSSKRPTGIHEDRSTSLVSDVGEAEDSETGGRDPKKAFNA